MQWKVGKTQETMYSSAGRSGFGFSIQDYRGMPLLTITYNDEAEAIKFEEAVRAAIEAAADVTKP